MSLRFVRIACLSPFRAAVGLFLAGVESAVYRLSGLRRKTLASPYLHHDWEPQHKVGLHKDVKVTGSLPKELDGAYMRVGPNPGVLPPRSPMHLFDGDGAVSVFRIEDGTASLNWDWVKTEKLDAVRKGKPCLNLGSISGPMGLFYLMLHTIRKKVGIVDFAPSTANTALFYHARKMLALNESGMPYSLRVLCDGAMETLGRCLFGGEYDGPMTAHPKSHPNGNAYFISYSFDKGVPSCSMQAVDRKGVLLRNFPVPLPRPVMIHDMAVTERFVIVMDLPLVFDPEAMVREGGLPFKFRKDIKSRFGLVPADAEDASTVRWFELDEAFFIFHTACAYDVGDTVVIWAPVLETVTLDVDSEFVHEGYFSKITLNLRTGEAMRTKFDMPGMARPGKKELKVFDFPTIHPSKTGLPVRYVYIADFETPSQVINAPFGCPVGCVKFDVVEQKEVGRFRFNTTNPEADVHGGETLFVPRESQDSEDDGWLVCLVVDHSSQSSALHVYDAKEMSGNPIAVVHSPTRLPSGFHTMHVPLAKLKQVGEAA